MDIVTLALAKKYANNKIADLGKVFTIKGTVASKSELPATGNQNGDVYLVGPDGEDGSYDEYVWNGRAWDIMGKSFESSIIKGSTPPAASQPASFIGQIYVDKTANEVYQCTNIENNIPTWVRLVNNNNLTVLTQAEYDDLEEYGENTFYFIEED